MAKSKKEKRLARKQKKKELKSQILDDKEARFKYIYNLGYQKAKKKFQEGKGKNRHTGKITGDNYRYITSEKTYNDVKAVWRRFAQFVAEYSDGTDLNSIDDVVENYVNEYLKECMEKGLSAFTLTTYKAHLGKIFEVPTTYFIATPQRKRADIKRSRNDVKSDNRVGKERREFFDLIGKSTGMRRKEMEQVRGIDLVPKQAKNGLYYIHLTRGTKGGKERYLPIMANNDAELEQILEYFRLAKDKRVFTGKNGTFKVPTVYDEHNNRSDYAKRVYDYYERDLSTLKRDQITFLRKELAGCKLDKYAEKKVCEALGHNRASEFRKSYAHKIDM